MKILGINSFFEHPAAALVIDGKLVFAIEDERLTRVKNGKKYSPYTAYVPYAAICAALRHAGLRAGDIDEVAVSYSSRKHLTSLTGCLLGRRLSSLSEEISAYRSARHLQRALQENHELLHGCRDVWQPGELGRAAYREWDHHLAHAASAFFCSGFDDALVVIADGSGERACTSVYHGCGRELRLVEEIQLPHSLGFLYSFVTRHLGFEPFSDEYKVMGLAAYGKPAYARAFDDLISEGNGRYYIRRDRLLNLESILGPVRKVGEEIEQRHMDIAQSLQGRLEAVLTSLVAHHLKRSPAKNLCVAGGVFLNCVANGKLARLPGVVGFFAQPAAHDAGTAVGAAALSVIERGGAPQLMYPSMLLGTGYDDAKIERQLRESVFTFEKLDPERMRERVADLLAQEKVVAMFRDRIEFGPRSLGARSFLASPRSAKTRDKLNCIKGREQFRPLAPAVMEDAYDRFFEGVPNRYMMLAVKAKDETKELAPAVVHADGTSRVQVVRPGEDPYFHELLRAFKERTGMPILINTSLNTRGLPIDESPVQALTSACCAGVDALAIGSFLVLLGPLSHDS